MTCNRTVSEFVVHVKDEEADKILVRFVSGLMADKLFHKRAEGRSGWHRRDYLERDSLEDMLTEHVDTFVGKHDDNQLIDIINLAGMLLVRSALYNDREKE